MFPQARSLFSLVRKIGSRPAGAPVARCERARFRPWAEVLEDRNAPAVFNVTVLTDGVNAVPAGSLRAAVNALIAPGNNDANNQIVFANGLNGTIGLVQALPTITKNVELKGRADGAISQVTIARAAAAANFRIFYFNIDQGRVSVSGLTISGGNAGDGSGGGILAVGLSSLLIGSVITNNQAQFGAGVWSNAGTTSISRSTFINNRATGAGGALDFEGGANSTLQIDNSVFTDNGAAASVGGGAIAATVNRFTINVATFRDNTAANNGGAIWVQGVGARPTANFTRATFTDNAATNGSGGAILNAATPVRGTIRNSIFEGNRAQQGGAIDQPGMALRIVDDAVFDNSAVDGGGFFVAAGGDQGDGFFNSTIADNAAEVGGGIYFQAGATASLTNATIAGNTATTAGGVYLESGANVSAGNTIIARNTDTAGTPDLNGVFTSLGNNLIGNPTGSSGWISSGLNMDLLGADPMLEPLGNYGGDTQSMPPMLGSPAIDAGNNALAVDADGNTLATDQRGFARIVNGTVDIGAVEVQPNEAGIINIALTSSENPAVYGDTVTLSASVTAAYSSSGTPTGSVTFYDGTTPIGTDTLVAGAASVSISTLTAGDHTITAVYSGDSTFNSQTSDPSDQLVLQATPTVTWNTPADITYGTALDSTNQLNAIASFAGNTVAGSYSYSQPLGTVLNAGSNQILSVTFTPTDTIDFASVTQTVTINVNPAILTVTADPQTMIYGSSVPTLTATITGFVNGDDSSVVSGAASLSTDGTSSSPVGSYAITATQGSLFASNSSWPGF